jgi:hypothetical protein
MSLVSFVVVSSGKAFPAARLDGSIAMKLISTTTVQR